ncbi:MAG: nicotinate-nucleotide--dimethylbenzimidazole phosphoribosyltransferase [Pseudomonadota bacterium]
MLADLTIPMPPEGLSARVQQAIDAKTKPQGALGRLEALALAMALAQGRPVPEADPACLLLFAADHGLVAEGVSAWPQEVTAQMVLNFLGGGAAATVFARHLGAEVRVLDAGVASPLPDAPGLARAGVRAGTRNALTEDALTPGEVEAILAFGAREAIAATERGARIVLLGEMGIGNTATATLLGHALTGLSLAALTGPGAGLDPAGVAKKRAVLERTAARRPEPLTPLEALAAFGGLEVAAMAGALIGAASRQAVVVVDGFIATVAALVALTARPEAAQACVFAHRGAEPGHAALLDQLKAEPLLTLDLRLGEGTGALLALPLLRAAAAMVAEMATFEQAAVSEKRP